MALSRYLLLLMLALTGTPGWADEEPSDIDPWEPVNRRIFAFNEGLDEYVLRPVARGYRAVAPDPVEHGVRNFISNIYEFTSIINSILQGNPENTFHTTGRFLVNSTIGFFGFFDVATGMGVEHRLSDYGQTLALWGFDQGPFVMLPILGPRTVRSTVGQGLEAFTSLPYLYGDERVSYAFFTAEAIDIRVQLLDAEELVSGDRYIFTRNVYLQRREYLISGGHVEDDFSENEDDFEEF